MIPEYAKSLGGKKTAIILRKIAIDKYYKNPNFCKNCNKIIEVENRKVSIIRIKKFCNKNCSAIFNNKKREKKSIPKIKKIKKIKIKNWDWLTYFTKKEVFDKHKNWQSARSSIRRHAKFIFDTEIKVYKCINCNYDKHIEICHINSVSSFKDDSKILDINNKNNLIALCPNCHWEFDNGFLKIPKQNDP